MTDEEKGVKENIDTEAPTLLEDIQDNASESLATAKDNFIATLLLLVSFLQQLSLIQVDGLEFELWGEVFAFLKALSLNVNLEFGEEEQEVALLTSVVLIPVLLLAMFNFQFETKAVAVTMATYRKPVLLTKSFWFILVCGIFSMVIGIVVYFTVDERTIGTFFIVLSGYFGLYIFYVTVVFGYFKVTDKEWLHFKDNYKNFKIYEQQTLVALWISSVAILGSVVFETGILNDNQVIKVIFSIIGSLSLFYMTLFLLLIAKVSTTEFISLDFKTNVSRVFCLVSTTFENRGETNEEGNIWTSKFKFSLFDRLIPYLKNEHWYFLFLLSIEKLLLVFAQSILITLIEPEFAAIFDLVVLVLIFVVVAVTKPYKEKLNNIAEISSRFSNLLLLISSILLTFFPDEEDLENGLNVVMLTISGITAVFWLYILWKLQIFNKILKSFTNRFTFIKAYFEKKSLFSTNIYEEFNAKIMNYPNGEIPHYLWNKLNTNEKLVTMTVLRGDEVEQLHLNNNALLISLDAFKNEEYSEGFRKFGFSFSRNFKDLEFSGITFTKKLTKFLHDSKIFENQFQNFDNMLYLNNCSAHSLDSMFSVFSQNSNFIYLFLSNLRLNSKNVDQLCNYLESAVHLKQLQLEGNQLVDADGVKIIEALRHHELENLTLVNIDFSVQFYEKVGQVLESDTDHLFCKRIKYVENDRIPQDVFTRVQNIVQLRRRDEPELSFGNFPGKRKDVFMTIDDKVVGFSRDFWDFLNKGVNCLVLPSLVMLDDEEREAAREFINFTWEDIWVNRTHGKLGDMVEDALRSNAEYIKTYYFELGLGNETVTEVILRKGKSHIAETLEMLLEFGADLSLKTADNKCTLLELAQQMSDEEVKKLVS